MDAFSVSRRWIARLSWLLLVLVGTGCSDARCGAGDCRESVAKAQSALVTGADLILLIDASAVISDAEFQTQVAAVSDTIGKMPHDGTYTLGVKQIAANITPAGSQTSGRDAFPLTVLDSDQTANSLIDVLRNLERFRFDFLGLTCPGDGIAESLSEFTTYGDPNHLEAICLTTGGSSQSGMTMPEALALGGTQFVALDRLGIMVLGDGAFEFDQAEREYAEFAFGGGTFSYANTATGFEGAYYATCVPPVQIDQNPRLTLVGLEAVQTVQSWSNVVPLIEGKDTFVRAHVQVQGATQAFAGAELIGVRDGVTLGTLQPLHGSILVSADATAKRGELSSSFLFQLPKTWLTGDVELEVRGTTSTLTCQEPDDNDPAHDIPGDCKIRANFLATSTPEVRFCALDYVDSTGIRRPMMESALGELALRLQAIYPVADVSWDATTLAYDDPIEWDLTSVENARKAVEAMAAEEGCTLASGCERLYYGAFVRAPPQDVNHDVGGIAPLNGIAGVGLFVSDPERYRRNVHAHEIGHLLGRDHAAFIPAEIVESGPPRLLDPCGSESDSGEPFPYDFMVDKRRATIGPLTPDQSMIFGLDTHQMRAVHPREHFELMSYCGGSGDGINQAGDDPNFWRWISDFTYVKLRSAIDARFSASSSGARGLLGPSALDAGGRYLLFRGEIDPSTGTLDPSPVLTTTSTTLFEPTSGAYRLELSTSSGASIASIPFDVEQLVVEETSEPRKASFMVPVLARDGIAEARVRHGDTIVGTMTASPRAPTVHLLVPNGGEVFASDSAVTVHWTGSDGDGDTLSYGVQYSADDGLTWNTLSAATTASSLTIDTSSLKGSTRARFRVLVTDGFNTDMDASDGTFTVRGSAPSAFIRFPKTGDEFMGNPIVVFDALAIDHEDGRLFGDAVVWSSDRDGELGGGAHLELFAENLSAGQHTITVSATDSDGLAGTATVIIYVSRQSMPGTVPRADLQSSEVLEVRDGIQIDVGSMLAGRGLIVGRNSHIDADVGVDGDASFGSDSTLVGNLVLSGSLLAADPGFIDGAFIPRADFSSIPTDIPGKVVVPGADDVSVKKRKTFALVPGSYGVVQVQSGAVLRLSPGRYQLLSLQLNPDSRLVVDAVGGNVEVDVAGALVFGNRSTIDARTPSDILLYSNTLDPIRIGRDVQFVGTVVAPQAELDVSARNLLTLRAAARHLVVQNDSQLQ